MVRPRLVLPAGLRRDTAATLLGIQPTDLSRYLNGRLVPGPRVADRLERFAALEPDSAYAQQNLWTMPRLAAWARAHREEIGQTPGSLLQPLSDGLGRLRFLGDRDRDFLLSPPGTTGDVRYNALLAGAAQYWCDRLGIPRPMWTRVPPLAREWLVYPEFEAWSRRKANPQLAALNIVLDTGSLDKA